HPSLWSLLPEKTDPIPVIPEWPEFIRGCVRYRQSLDEQAPNAPRTNEPYERRSALTSARPESEDRSGRIKDMTNSVHAPIKLFQFPRMFGIPNLSPFCCKLETWLRITRVPYEVVDTPDPRKGPKGKLPFIQDAAMPIADSSR